MDLTQDRLKEVMHYDPLTGQFTWAKTLSRRAVAGTPAGNPYSNGYLRLQIDGQEYLCHRLAWLYMTGEFPESELDHRNRIRSDNSWDNLRASNTSLNKFNTGLSSRNKSGVKGVSWSSKRSVWQAGICAYGKKIYVGEFKELSDAEAAIIAARLKYHGDFAN